MFPMDRAHLPEAVVTSSAACFRAPLRAVDWDAVSWIGSNTTNVYKTRFSVADALPHDATFFVAGLGYSVVKINGEYFPGMRLTTPAWTPNERLVAFSSLDVRKLLKVNQENEIEVALGHGWRNMTDYPSRDGELGLDLTQSVCFVLKLVFTTSDGQQKIVSKTGDDMDGGSEPGHF